MTIFLLLLAWGFAGYFFATRVEFPFGWWKVALWIFASGPFGWMVTAVYFFERWHLERFGYRVERTFNRRPSGIDDEKK
jgi:hypothetical protein